MQVAAYANFSAQGMQSPSGPGETCSAELPSKQRKSHSRSGKNPLSPQHLASDTHSPSFRLYPGAHERAFFAVQVTVPDPNKAVQLLQVRLTA